MFSVTYFKGDRKKKERLPHYTSYCLEEAEFVLTCNCVPLQTPALRIIAVAISLDFKVTDRVGVCGGLLQTDAEPSAGGADGLAT